MLSLESPVLRPFRRLWQALPLPYAARRAVTGRLHKLLFPAPRPQQPAFAKRPAEKIAPGDLIVSGFHAMPTGIGRGGRIFIEGFRKGGLSPRLHDMALDPRGLTLRGAAPGGVWLTACNPPETLHFMHLTAEPVYRRRYRIGFWAWELPELPDDWKAAIPLFHEIWTGSPYVAAAVRRAAEGTGVIVRMTPFPLPQVSAAPDRERFGWRPGELAVLCMYDVRSTAARKNPMGAVDAFQRAFTAQDPRARLVIKVNAPDAEAGRLPPELAARIAGWPNISTLVAELTDADADALLASADVFVSLHRSEGFGLSIAQSMVLGRAVIATAYSGNAEFQAGGAIDVPYTLVPALDPSGRYDMPGQMWAEPDIGFAADALRRLADDPAELAALGARARAVIAERLPARYTRADFGRWLAPGA